MNRPFDDLLKHFCMTRDHYLSIAENCNPQSVNEARIKLLEDSIEAILEKLRERFD